MKRHCNLSVMVQSKSRTTPELCLSLLFMFYFGMYDIYNFLAPVMIDNLHA
jgi:hypothetical protein